MLGMLVVSWITHVSQQTKLIYSQDVHMRENNDHQQTAANLYGSSDLRPPISHARGYLLT